MIGKVLVINKYHFISGGAERYFLGVMEALKRRNIEPIPFSINYPKTLPTPYRKYFPDPVVQHGEAKIVHQKPSLNEQLQIGMNAIYNRRAAQAVAQICEEHKPDAAYLLNINNHISPSVIDACARKNVPVVMRMSDFNLVCASNMYFRNGMPCTDCKSGLHHAILNRCVHGSYARSAAAVLANSLHKLTGIYRQVSAFVAPTQWMKNDLIESGIPVQKIHHIPTFAPANEVVKPDLNNPYIVFSGRFVSYKGVELAIKAFARTKASHVRFYVIGDEDDDESKRIRELAQKLDSKRIKIMRFQRDKKRMLNLIGGSLFALVPSRFYENLPNTILEAFSCGRPVIGTNIGSIPEVIQDGRNGLLFKPEDDYDLAAKIDWLIAHNEEREAMGKQAFNDLLTNYSENGHMVKLLELFRSVSQTRLQEKSASSAAALHAVDQEGAIAV
jgi:glycosyltransferase involved in cell wall biosynthesis